MRLWHICVFERHVVVSTVATKNFVAGNIYERWSFQLIICKHILPTVIGSKRINVVYWFATKFNVIRNVALKLTNTKVFFLLDLFLSIPSYGTYLWTPCHSQRNKCMHVCLTCDKIRILSFSIGSCCCTHIHVYRTISTISVVVSSHFRSTLQ